MYIIIFFLYAIISSFGLYFMKTARIGLNLNFVFGFFLYLSGFLIWIKILKIYPLTISFPIAASLLMVATQIIGLLLLKEDFSIVKGFGVLIIIIGIIMISSTAK